MCRFCGMARAQMNAEGGIGVQDKLAMENCSTLSRTRVPCTLITGFLGSGKTTLLNHILRGSHGKRYAVIENEFGAMPVDDALLASAPERSAQEIVVMPNGCMCCRVRGDLVAALGRIIENTTGQLDGVLLETSGLSEVGPVVQTFFSDTYVQSRLRLDAVVCVCDTAVLADTLQAGAANTEGVAKALDLTLRQLVLADRVLLNKVDLLGVESEEVLARLSKEVRDVNKTATIVPSKHGEVDLDLLLNVNAFALERSLEIDTELFDAISTESAHSPGHSHSATAEKPHAHEGFANLGVEISDEPLNRRTLEDGLQEFVLANPGVLTRVKGLVWTEAGRVVVHGVFGHFESRYSETAYAAGKRTRIVFIGMFTPQTRTQLTDLVHSARASVVKANAAKSAATAATNPSPSYSPIAPETGTPGSSGMGTGVGTGVGVRADAPVSTSRIGMVKGAVFDFGP